MVAEWLKQKSLREPDRVAFVFLESPKAHGQVVTYGYLWDEIEKLKSSNLLQLEKGERVVLFFEQGLEFIVTFFAVLSAGAIAVPLYPPKGSKRTKALLAVLKDCDPKLAFTQERLLIPLCQLFRESGIGLKVYSVARLLPNAFSQEISSSSNDVAFLQYTSGSTGQPKGVMVTHGSILANMQAIMETFGTSSEDVCVSWLPAFHDMGLLGCIMQAVYRGFPTVLFSPLQFAKKPLFWLETISNYRATLSGGPNFGYSHALAKYSDNDFRNLDLGSWRVAFNGAEPVQAGVIQEFSRVFATCGFSKTAFFPCYGMAEATLLLSGAPLDEATSFLRVKRSSLEKSRVEVIPSGDVVDARPLVSCGPVISAHQLVIVDPETGNLRPQGWVGEICVRGPSIAKGYWNNREETARHFEFLPPGTGGKPYLRTGDLGFVSEGRLFLTGRLKDLIILRGRNVYPEDLEATSRILEESYRNLATVAFSIEDVEGELLVILQEIPRNLSDEATTRAMMEGITRALVEEFQLAPDVLGLLKPGTLLKTTSGKIKRKANKKKFLENGFSFIAILERKTRPPEAGPPIRQREPDLEPCDPIVLDALREMLSDALEKPVGTEGDAKPFTELGLDSIGAASFVQSVETRFGIEIPPEEVMLGLSLRDVAHRLGSPKLQGHQSTPQNIPNIVPTIPLSPGQEALWYLHQMDPGNAMYHIHFAVKISPNPDWVAVKNTFLGLMEAHGALRAVIRLDASGVGQVDAGVHNRFFTLIDASGMDASQITQQMQNMVQLPFHPTKEVMWRCVGLQSSQAAYLLVVMHHLIGDHHSLISLMAQWGDAYPLFLGRHSDFPQSDPALRAASFGEYQKTIAELQTNATSDQSEMDKRFWKDHLDKVPTQLQLPYDFPKPVNPTFKSVSLPLHFSKDIKAKIEELARAVGGTPFMVFCTLFQLFLHRYTQQKQILLGTPVSLRKGRAQYRSVGYFANAVCLKSQFSGEATLRQMLAKGKDTIAKAFQHRRAPFHEIVKEMGDSLDASSTPLFQVLFVWQQTKLIGGASAFGLAGTEAAVALGGHRLEHVPLAASVTPFDLSLVIAPVADGYAGAFHFRQELFTTETMARILGHFATFLENAVGVPDQGCEAIPLLTPQEIALIGVTWNQREVGFNAATLPERFRRWAQLQPDAVALVVPSGGSNLRLTYRALDEGVEHLANWLVEQGVGAGDLVAVCIDRSEQLILSMLAIQRVHGVYVPLDPNYPMARFETILEDCRAGFVLTERVHQAKFASFGVKVLVPQFDAAHQQAPAKTSQFLKTPSEYLSHVIYTSGSTGKPKGVLIHHRATSRLVDALAGYFPDRDLEGVLAATSICFDLSVFEIHGTFARGGRVVLVRDALALAETKLAHEVRLINTVPSAMKELLRMGAVPNAIRVVNLAGEALSRNLVSALYQRTSVERVFNLYGPSEDTTYSTVSLVPKDLHGPPAIGHVLAGSAAFVLDPQLRLLPPGVSGELILGGEGLANGYYRSPGLTAQSFVPNPYSKAPGERLYKTGDWARYSGVLFDAGGVPELFFQGRRDHQVKIRGFRIELDEIKAVLEKHPEVEACVVSAVRNPMGETVIGAYIVKKDGEKCEPIQGLSGDLGRVLPHYMIPSLFGYLEKIPLTPNGKINHKALPDLWQPSSKDQDEAQLSALEKSLRTLWQEVLGIQSVPLNVPFLELGGHSLSAVKLVTRIEATLGIRVPLRTVLQAGTLENLARTLETLPQDSKIENWPSLVPVPGSNGLSLAQQRLWFMNQLEPGSRQYNLTANFLLLGNLSVLALQMSFHQLAIRHEVVRQAFYLDGDTPRFRLGETLPFSISDLSDLAESSHALASLKAGVTHLTHQLERGKLFRVFLFRISRDEHILCLSMHHSIADGWSLQIIAKEISTAYRHYSQAFSPANDVSGPLPVQYSDFAHWQQVCSALGLFRSGVAFWEKALADAPPLLRLPLDHPRPPRLPHRLGIHEFTASSGALAGLDHLVKFSGATKFTVLGSIFGVFLAKICSQNDVVFGTPVANRLHQNLESLIGFFANTVCLRMQVDENETFGQHLGAFQNFLEQGLSYQETPFEQVVEALAIQRDLSHHPLFQALFVFEPSTEAELDLGPVSVKGLPSYGSQTKFDLSLYLKETESGLTGLFEYEADLFLPKTLQLWEKLFDQLITQLGRFPKMALNQVELGGLTPKNTIDPGSTMVHKGYWVEVDRIQACARECAGIGEAVVLSQDVDGRPVLVAHVETQLSQTQLGATLGQHLKSRLPKYMVPEVFVAWTSLPLTALGDPDVDVLIAANLTEDWTLGQRAPGKQVSEIRAIWENILQKRPIEPHDNFFELGGTSLSAIRVTSEVQSQLGAVISVRALFEAPTLGEFVRLVAQAAPDKAYFASSSEHLLETTIALTPGQSRMWFVEDYARNLPRARQPDYVLFASIVSKGMVNLQAIQDSLDFLALRHESLRTTFESHRGSPLQRIHTTPSIHLEVVDLGELSLAAQAEALATLKREAEGFRFPLEQQVLFKFVHITLDGSRGVFYFFMHHLVSDRWSLEVLIREFVACYRAYVQGHLPQLAPLKFQYQHYLSWQRTWEASSAGQTAGEFWETFLGDAPRVLKLPRRAPLARPSFESQELDLVIDAPLTKLMDQFAGTNGLTPFIIFQAVLALTLKHYGCGNDLVLGTPFANRRRPEFQSVVGLMVNTLVLRPNTSGNPTFVELCQRIKAMNLAVMEQGDYPFERVLERTAIQRDPLLAPFVQVMLVVEDATSQSIALPGCVWEQERPGVRNAKFEMTLSLTRDGESFQGTLGFLKQMFDSRIMERLARHFVQVTGEVLQNPQRNIENTPVLSPTEARILQQQWSHNGLGIAEESPFFAPIASLVFKNTAALQDKVAVEGGTSHYRHLTFGFLRSLAHRIRNQVDGFGLGPERVIAIFGPRNAWHVAAMLAIQEGGWVWLALPHTLPKERLKGYLAEAQVGLVLAETEDAHELADTGVPILTLESALAASAAAPEPKTVLPNQLAYLIFTSGSTGKPKAVALTHQGLLSLVAWHRREFRVNPDHRASQTAEFSFDASVWEIWPYLAAGASVSLLPEPLRFEAEELFAWLDSREITHAFLATTLADHLAKTPRVMPKLQWLLTGGDRLERMPKSFELTQWANNYGPTENTVVATSVNLAGSLEGLPPIGRPIDHVSVWVLDGNLNLVPPGVEGELFLGGPGLARGYLGRFGQTAAAFVPHPFSAIDPRSENRGARLYRTGDRVRFLENGHLEFIGRLDGQVKLSGYRIELGEIEAHLKNEVRVDDAVVLKEETASGLHLRAIIATKQPLAFNGADLQKRMRDRLPHYMVPTKFQLVEELPYLASGKPDRARLMAMASENALELGPVSQPLVGKLERAIAQIWSEEFGKPIQDRAANFFNLGGHSLGAAQLVHRCSEVLGVTLPVHLLFEAPTLGEFCESIQKLQSGTQQIAKHSVGKENQLGIFPLSSQQHRLWFFNQLDPSSTAYNMPFRLKLEGRLDVLALAEGLDQILERHAVLRSVVRTKNGEPFLQVQQSFKGLSLWDAGELPPPNREALLGCVLQPFQLDQALFRAVIVRWSDRHHLLILDFHHLVFDGESLSIFLDELETNYQNLISRHSAAHPPLPIQYHDYALWQREQLQKGALKEQLAYWKAKLWEAPELRLPFDGNRSSEGAHQGTHASRNVDQARLAALKKLSQDWNVSLFVVLLAAFKVLLAKHAGQKDVSIGIPIMARSLPELRNLIGFFVNTVVVRTSLESENGFREYVDQVNQTMLEAHRNQDAPFDQVVAALQPKRERNKTPLFQVFFNMVGRELGPPQFFGLQAEASTSPALESKFDMTLYVFETQQELTLQLHYNSELFAQARIETYLDQYLDLFAQIIGDSRRSIETFSLARRTCRPALPDLDTALRTQAEQPIFRTILARCRLHGDAVAGSLGDAHLTYAMLDSLSQNMALQLNRAEIHQGDMVVVLASRSLELLPAMLGVFRHGCILVLVDAGYPVQRMQAMVETVTPSALIFAEQDARQAYELHSRFPNLTLVPVSISANPDERLPEEKVEMDVDAPAYVLFTSGTSGKPQAVVASHRPLSHFATWQEETFGLHSEMNASMLSGLGHDPLLRDVLVTLSYGGRVVIPPADPVTMNIKEWLCRNCVDIVHVTPAMAMLIRGNDEKALKTPRVQALFFGGDRLTPAHARQARGWAPGAKLVNFYGTTETPQAMAYQTLDDSHLQPQAIIPIGKGISQVQLLVLNEREQLCGVGELGMVWVRTPYLSLGYLGEPKRNDEKFKYLPTVNSGQERLYCTGDLGRYNASGEVVYAGRIDRQIKIRGYRVELAEIEACARAFSQVKEAAALYAEATGEVLLLWEPVHPLEDGTATDELRAHLMGFLPQAMMPQRILLIDNVPLTQNRKIDYQALSKYPIPALMEAGSEAFSTLEAWVAGIWQEILGVQVVHPLQNFFELGGHSLHLGQLLARIRAVFEVQLGPAIVFERPRLRDFCQVVAEIQGKPHWAPLAVGNGEPEGPQPLSFSQERIWLLEQISDLGSAYHITNCWEIQGRVSPLWLADAWRKVVERHSILRSRIVLEDDEPRLVTDTGNPAVFLVMDGTPIGTDPKAIQALLQKMLETRFDYSEKTPCRVVLVALGPETFLFQITVHHLLADGWSLAIIMEDLAKFYAAFAQNTDLELAPLKVNFGDFAQWQRKNAVAESAKPSLAYWQDVLKNPPSALAFPSDFPRPSILSYRGATLAFDWGSETTQLLNQTSLSLGVTPFMFLLSAWTTLLFRYSHQEDMILGIPVAGRGLPEFENMVGFFANTLPLRLRPSREMSFATLLQQVKAATLAAMTHEQIPFESFLDRLNIPRNLSHHALFQVMFIYQNAPEKAPEFPGLQWLRHPVSSPSSKFDMTLSCTQTKGHCRGSLEYNSDLYLPETMTRLLNHFQRVCEAFLKNPNLPLAAVEFLSKAERLEGQLLANPSQHSEGHLRLDKWIFAALSKEPGRELLCAESDLGPQKSQGKGWWTRSELLSQTHHLAEYLGELGVGAETAVGVCMDRTPAMVVALLAILKAGGYYVPLDPAFPQDRLSFILAHARPTWVLTDAVSAPYLPESEASLVYLTANADFEKAGSQRPTPKASCTIEEQASAYQLYTSGSTGRPKGVRVSHRNVINLLGAMAHKPGLSETDTFLAVTTLSFDIAGLELFLPLVTGARLVIAKTATQSDPNQLANLVSLANATAMQATPTTWEMLREAGWRPPSGMKLLCGGEALPYRLGQWFSQSEGSAWNLYGPTETTIWSSRYFFENQPEKRHQSIPLGQPIDHTSLFVLDASLHLVPRGVIGELCIGGQGVTTGYHQQPGLTAEAFIPNPFAVAPEEMGTRLYKTGDLVRLHGGDLFFVGRKDFQVKLRGFRIELGDIEQHLLTHPGVSQAVAVLHTSEKTDEMLIAYVLLEPTKSWEESNSTEIVGELKEYLSTKVPKYMVPTQIEALEEFPKTANGKIDRKMLATRAPSLTQVDTIRLPTKLLEQQLFEIWKTVLGRDDFGIDQNFFELGGHSLQATKTVGRIRQSLGMELPVRFLFQAPTIAQFASLLETQDGVGVEQGHLQTIPVQTGNVFPLSAAQRRMWFLQQTDPSGFAYNMTQAVKISGQVAPVLIEKAITGIVESHEGLRTRFGLSEGAVFQEVLPLPSHALTFIDLQNLPDAAKAEHVQNILQQETQFRFQLEEMAPFRYSLIVTEATCAILLLNAHHILADGWSLALFFKEFLDSYQALLTGKTLPKKRLPIQYKDFSEWQNTRIAEGLLEDQKAYWLERLQALPLPVEIGNVREDGSFGKKAGVVAMELDSAIIQGVDALASHSKLTPFMVYLAGFQLLMYRLSQEEDQVVGVPIANRTHPQTEDLIGCFANTLVFRTQVQPSQSFLSLSLDVKTSVLGAFEHQDYPLDLLVENLNPQRSRMDAALFNHLFIFQNVEMEEGTAENFELEPIETPVQTAKFDLVFSLGVHGSGIRARVEYSRNRWTEDGVHDLAQAFVSLLRTALSHPEMSFNQWSMPSRPARVYRINDENLRGFAAFAQPVGYPVDHLKNPVLEGSWGFLQLDASIHQKVPADCLTPLQGWPARSLANGQLVLASEYGGKACIRGRWVDVIALEKSLLEIPEIWDLHTWVRPTTDGQDALVFYCVPSGPLSLERLNEKILASLKSLDVPWLWEPVARLPFRLDGSVDRRELLKIPVGLHGLVRKWQAQLETEQAVSFTLLTKVKIFEEKPYHLYDIWPQRLQSAQLIQAETAHKSSNRVSPEQPQQPSVKWANYVGPNLEIPPHAPRTLTEALARTAEEHPNRGITFLHFSEEPIHYSYQQLYRDALRGLTLLRNCGLKAGDVVILQMDVLQDHLPIFWSCLLGGVIPVTIAVPREYQETDPTCRKLLSVWEALKKPVILCSQSLQPQMENLSEQKNLASFQTLSMSDFRKCEPDTNPHAAEPEETAFMQLTSGSTGVPKAIPEVHRAVIAHIHSSQQFNDYSDSDKTLNWLPFDHVVPILTFHLKDVYLGIEAFQAPTHWILEDPVRWLTLLSTYEITHSWSPNFGFKLVARALSEGRKGPWSLDHVKYLMNAGEQVTLPTMQAFLALTQPFGMRAEALQPAFGMAEVCTCMTYHNGFQALGSVFYLDRTSLGMALRQVPPDFPDSVTFVKLGPVAHGAEMRIVDSENRLLPEGVIGRFQIKGPMVMPGYYQNPGANEESFVGDGWFNSGDLGFILDGELALTGREKEIIIINGANFGCYEVEDVVGRIEGVLPAHAAVTSVFSPESNTEEMVIFFVPVHEDSVEYVETLRMIRAKIGEHFGLHPRLIIPLPKSEFARTTSGKIQRLSMKDRLAKGAFDGLIRDLDKLLGNEYTVPRWFYEAQWVRRRLSANSLERVRHALIFDDALGLGDSVIDRLREVGISVSKVVPGRSFREVSSEIFEIRPSERTDYQALLEAIPFPDLVIHGWVYGLPEGEANQGSQGRVASEGLFSLLAFSQTLQEIYQNKTTTLVVACRRSPVTGTTRVPQPDLGMLPGFLASLAVEMPWIQARLVDFEEPFGLSHAELLLHEAGDPRKELRVAYRRGDRYIQRLRALPLEKPAPCSGSVELKQQGVYLLSGGLGALGFELAKHLLTRYRATLLLIGRQSLDSHLGHEQEPSSPISRLKALQALPGKVIYCAADVLLQEPLERVVEDFEKQIGKNLQGVFHLAGILRECPLQSESSETMREVLAPKVEGTKNLYGLLQSRSNAFMVNFSSVTATFGTALVGAYAAANSFLDAFVEEHQDPRVFSMQWSAWGTLGMTLSSQREDVLKALGFEYVDPEKGFLSMELAMKHAIGRPLLGIHGMAPAMKMRTLEAPLDYHHAVLCFSNHSKPLKLNSLSKRDAFGVPVPIEERELSSLPRTPAGAIDAQALTALMGGAGVKKGTYVKPEEGLEEEIAEIWGSVLGTKPGVTHNFFDLGGTSIAAAQVAGQLGKRHPITVIDLFQHPTIRELAQFLNHSQPKGESVQEGISRGQLRQKRSAQQRLRRRSHDS